MLERLGKDKHIQENGIQQNDIRKNNFKLKDI
jgi:hypothetical protein